MICRLGVVILIISYIVVTSAMPPCVCTRERNPVCGSDGQTYSNECSLNCKQFTNPELNIKIAYKGNCISALHGLDSVEVPCVCTMEYEPFCGTDGITYPNKCSLKCGKGDIEIAYKGECKPELKIPDNVDLPCICTLEYEPFCGTDGITYPNKCSLKCGKSDVKVAYKGECRPKRETYDDAELHDCVCTRERRPVCGTDGKTYSNPCMLNCAREANENLHIDHTGRCKTVTRSVGASCACTRNFAPVCASNGLTYSNECLMRCSGEELSIVTHGPCDIA